MRKEKIAAMGKTLFSQDCFIVLDSLCKRCADGTKIALLKQGFYPGSNPDEQLIDSLGESR